MVALTAHTRRTLRSIQRCLASSVPGALLDRIEQNDVDGWAALAMLEIRMLLARGQTHQTRQIAERLVEGSRAGLAVESYDHKEINLLINAIDSVLANRHHLAQQQLTEVSTSPAATLRWAADLWRARSLATDEDLVAARAAADRAAELAEAMGDDARCWTTCFSAEILARSGQAQDAEVQVLRVLSQFVGAGEIRGVSFAYLTLAAVAQHAGLAEDSAAAAELAHSTDGSWSGPVVWLARLALASGDVDGADQLLRSVPNPSTDAYSLLQTLPLLEARQIPPQAAARDLELSAAPATDEVLDEIRELLAGYPELAPAHETLAWKHLLRGERDQAAQQLQLLLADPLAQKQSIAALRFGLQEHESAEEPIATTDGAAELASPPTAAEATAAPAPPATEQPPGSKAAGFAGQLSLFGVTDLVQFFCNSRRTGQVLFSSQRGDARIRLHEGSLHWAVSPAHPNVGQFLHDRGAVSAEQLAPLAHEQHDAISSLLDQQGVDVDQVSQALRELVHLTLKELVDWTDGWFVFDAIHGAAEPRAELLFGAQGLLLDVLRELDEENR